MTTSMPGLLTDQWMRDLQNTVEDTLTDLDQWANEDPEDDEAPAAPSGMPYDGCLTCQVRETLTLAVTATVEAVMAHMAPETPPNRQE